MQHAQTQEGRVVCLRDDGTWEYSDSSSSALEKWSSLELTAEILQLFEGLFDSIGVRILDTGETLTCTHRGDQIDFAAGLDEDKVDFTVEIYSFQVDRLAQSVASGHIDELEQFRIARTLMARRSTGKANILRNPLFSNSKLRKITGAKNLIHEYLLSPDRTQEPDAKFTLIYVNNSWLLVPGFFGEPERIFKVSLADAVELQRQLLVGMRSQRLLDWIRIAKWYVEWRKKVEVSVN